MIKRIMFFLLFAAFLLPATHALTRTFDTFESNDYLTAPWTAVVGGIGTQDITTATGEFKNGTHGAQMHVPSPGRSGRIAQVQGQPNDWNAWAKADCNLYNCGMAYWITDTNSANPTNYVRVFRQTYYPNIGTFYIGTADGNTSLGVTQAGGTEDLWYSYNIIYVAGATSGTVKLFDQSLTELSSTAFTLNTGFTPAFAMMTVDSNASPNRDGYFDDAQYGGTAPPADTCTYVSGNWTVDLADNCNLTTDTDLGANEFTTTGTGSLTINAWITTPRAHLIGTNIHWMGKGFD